MRLALPIAIVAGSGITIGVAWLLLGRWISRLVDCCLPGQSSPQAADRMLIEFDPAGISGRFTLGSSIWPLSWPWPPGPFEVKVVLSRQGRLLLRADGRSFTFGPVQQKWTDSIKPQYQFVPEPGDGVFFTREIGRLPWSTPFTFNLMGVPTPKWKRHAHDRLRWTKPSGATLEITWTNEFWFYRRTGWSDCYMNRLAGISIRPSPIEKAVAAHLASTKGWAGNEYRLETESATSEDNVVSAIYLKDETAAHPGAGKSVVVRVNKLSGKVVGETVWQ